MNLPAFLPDGYILLLLIIRISPCHSWLLVSRESQDHAIRVGRVVVVAGVRVAVVVAIQEVRRRTEIRAAQPKIVGGQPVQNIAGALFQVTISFPVRFSQARKNAKFLIYHPCPFIHDIL